MVVNMGQSGSTEGLRLILVDKRADAQRVLHIAEQEDFYLQECQEDRANAIARSSLTYAPNSMEDADHYRLILDQALHLIPKRLKMDLGDVMVVPLMPSAEGGMPHTRPPNLLCFPNTRQLHSTSTLIHELWHLHQRQYAELWRALFQQLGWAEWNGVLPPLLESSRRYNPDTIDSPLWVYRNAWVPLPIFKDSTRPDIKEIDIWFYHVTNRYHVKTIPSELASFCPNLPSSAYEHPRELAAYVLAEPDLYKETPIFQALLKGMGHLAIHYS